MQTPIDTINGITIYPVWQTLTENLQQQLTDFWLNNGAIPQAEEAKRRTQEVVCLALDDKGYI